MTPRVVIIINPISGPPRRGRGAERVEIAVSALRALGAHGEVRTTERAGHAYELAREAAGAGAELVMAWGGDGTINEVARALVQRRGEGPLGSAAPPAPLPALGIIPGGSGNGLARELGIPFGAARAIARAIAVHPRAIDVGELGDHLFFNVAGIGLDAHVAALVSTRVHHRGFLPYMRATVRDLLAYRPSRYTIEANGSTLALNAVIVAVANSRQYGLQARIAPRASMTDGLLDLVAIEDRQLWGNLARAPFMFAGRIDNRPGVTVIQIREATIRSSAPMLFHVDGEAVQGSAALVARVHPGALRLSA